MSRDIKEATETRIPAAFRQLLPSDAGDVFALYKQRAERVEDGFLAERSLQDFNDLLAQPRRCAAVGAFSDEALIAYTLCTLTADPAYQNCPIIRQIQARGEPLWVGKGTIVDPAFEGRLLMSRLLKKRHEIISEHGAAHSAGLIAIGNLPSLAGALRAGSWIVGFEQDEYCLNFVCYAGPICLNDLMADTCEFAIEDPDIDALTERFEKGWVGTRLSRDRRTDKRILTLKRLSNNALHKQ